MRLNLRENLLYLATCLLSRCDRRARAPADYRPEKVRRVLLVSSTALGDTVLSTAAMVAMRQRFPAARIAALIHRDYLPLFRNADFLDETLPYHGGWRHFFATLRRLRRFHPDLALILHGNEPQATPLAYLAGARFIFKLPNTSRFAFLLTNRTPRLTWRDCGHGLHLRLKIAGLAGAHIASARMRLPLTETTRAAVAHWLAGRGIAADSLLVGFQAGASSRGRQWPVEHFVALAHRLLAVYPACRFIALGAPQEQAHCDQIAQRIGPAAVAAGMLPIEQLPALVERCAVLVTGDTGTLHVAVAVGTPTVSLFTVSDPAASGPAYDFDKHIVIHRPQPEGVRSKTDDPRWMAAILPEDVLPAVHQSIKTHQGRAHE